MSNKKLRSKGLSLKSITINADTWLYEERTKLAVIHQVRDNAGDYIKTIQINLPIRIIMPSVKKYEQLPQKGRKG